MDAQKKRKTGMSRKEQAARTRQRIKEATLTVLERDGYRSMRLVDVAKEAGIATGLFYHYFPDLKAVTCEVLTDFMAKMTVEARSVPHKENLFDTLYTQYLILIQYYEQHPGLMRCMLQVSDEIPEFGEIWSTANQKWTNSFARHLQDYLGETDSDANRFVLMAYCLGSMVDGVLHEYYVIRNPDLMKRASSHEYLAETLATLTYRAITFDTSGQQS